MYIIIKKFGSSSIEKSIEIAQNSFLPVVSKMPGFVDYHVIKASEDMLVSVLLFKSKAEGDASSATSKQWVIDNKIDSFFQLQELTAGEVVVQG